MMMVCVSLQVQVVVVCILLLLDVGSRMASAQRLSFGPFNSSHYNVFNVLPSGTISNGALQITPDSLNNEFIRQHKSGRVMFSQPFKLWDDDDGDLKVASFNTSFLINIYRSPNTTAGEGFAFIIAPDPQLMPSASEGQYLGLTNATLDALSSNRLIALELDTVKQDFDPDDNHMGLNINSIRSNKTVSLSQHGIEIAPLDPKNYTVWIRYHGANMTFKAYMALEGQPMPADPLMNEKLNIRNYVNQESYFGFAASTGNWTQLNCVLNWNLSVEILPRNKDNTWVKILVGVGVPGLAILAAALVGLAYYIKRRRSLRNDPNLLGALKSLPGMPREFKFKDLNKATNNFDDKNKLGQGGFGVVYKGVLPQEKIQIAVKKFSRESMKGRDDFLAELTIINRLRHKHLVKLVGWCHTNGMLLLVYDFMPNGSLDNHLFSNDEGKSKLGWERRYNIISGVASALHYLHNEYDQKVVHRDLKASNVMLDSDYNARLGDFGLARAIDNEKTSYAEMEQGVPGTPGYIAPECFHMGRATRESDVYGFGAVVLEVVCGQRPWTKIAGFQFLADWVWTLHREGRILEAVDEKLGNDYVDEQAKRLLLVGLACSHPIASERPKTQSIIQILSGIIPPPEVPPFKPSFVWPMMGLADDTNTSNYSQDTTPTASSYSGWTPREGYTDSVF